MFRPGQWLKYDGIAKGAHHAADGRIVGIHHDGFIHVVRPNGENLEIAPGINLIVPVDRQAHVEAITHAEDLPPGRAIHPGWEPKK